MKLDTFLFPKAYKKKHHGMYLTFLGLTRDTVFITSAEDLEHQRKYLEVKQFNEKHSLCYQDQYIAIQIPNLHTLCPGPKVPDFVERRIPSPEILAHCIQHIIFMCKMVK
jgi:hypothetical protein